MSLSSRANRIPISARPLFWHNCIFHRLTGAIGGHDEAENVLSHPVRYRSRSAVLAVCSLGLAEWTEHAAVLPSAIRQSHELVFWHGRARFRCGTSGFHAKRKFPVGHRWPVVADPRAAIGGRFSRLSDVSLHA